LQRSSAKITSGADRSRAELAGGERVVVGMGDGGIHDPAAGRRGCGERAGGMRKKGWRERAPDSVGS
jgi:hypothetical protein